MEQSENFWLKRTHTILLAGHGAALLLLSNIFSNDDDSLTTVRENIILFVPFIMGIGFLTWTAFRGITLDTYRSILVLRDTLEDSKAKNEKTPSNYPELIPTFNSLKTELVICLQK